jgi:hypothetical protein
MATLAHAFLAQALTGDTGNRLGLRDKSLSLKSYVFAQPKPGNWQFAMDFAQSQGNCGFAYTINNIRDFVPQVPLSIQLASETLAPVLRHSKFSLAKVAVEGLGRVRSHIARDASHFTNTISQVTAEFDDRFFVPGSPVGSAGSAGGQSLDYMPVGVVIAGTPNTSPGPKDDLLWEHHAGHYRLLVEGLGEVYP